MRLTEQREESPKLAWAIPSRDGRRRSQLTEALLWRYAWRNEAGNPTLQLYQQKMEEHER